MTDKSNDGKPVLGFGRNAVGRQHAGLLDDGIEAPLALRSVPLIPQQVILSTSGQGPAAAVAEIVSALADYPDCRIVTISISPSIGVGMVHIVAVVETV